MIKKSFKISIIDYKISNLKSVKNALSYLGFENIITSDSNEILKSDGVILPGVGSFPHGMLNLKELSLIESINKFILSGKPLIGICLGMQLLFDKSFEFKSTDGLGVIAGEVKNFKTKNRLCKTPHVGWNKIALNKYITNENKKFNPFKNLNHEKNLFYFVHSFFSLPKNKDNILTETTYNNINFCSSVLQKNVFATQFHLEKSGENGLEILKNFFNYFR